MVSYNPDVDIFSEDFTDSAEMIVTEQPEVTSTNRKRSLQDGSSDIVELVDTGNLEPIR